MAGVVIDSSFLIAVLIEEEHSAWASEAMLQMDDETFLAPGLLVWEAASVLQNKVRRGHISPSERAIVLERFDNLAIELHLPPEPAELLPLIALSEHAGLTVYDSAYLLLASQEDAGLASLDRDLVRAARAEGVAVHSPF